ncbi:MAG: hypothetical protein AAFP03_04910 [Cyanobacteria bacterium J06598_3]
MASTTTSEKSPASEEKVPEVVSTIQQIKSPWSCPVCTQKKLLNLNTDNWTEPKRFMTNPTRSFKRKPKKDLVTTSYCLNCNFGLTENEERKQMRERNDKNKGDGDQPWAAGTFFLMLMLGTILILTEYQNEQPGPSLVETIDQLDARL